MSNSISLENLQSAFAQNKAYTDAKYDEHFNKIDDMKNVVDDLNLRSMIGEKLDYCHIALSKLQTTVQNEYLNLNKIVELHGLDVDTNKYTVTLKANKTYEIIAGMYTYSVSGFTQAVVYDITNNIGLIILNCGSPNTNIANAGSGVSSCIFTPKSDCKIAVKLTTATGAQIINTLGTYITVKEIGRTHIVEPTDVKDKHIVEYGRFKLSTNQTTGFDVGSYIKFDTTEYSKNIVLNPTTNTIKLNANKTYKIDLNLVVGGTVVNYFRIKNVTDSTFIGGRLICVPPTSTRGHNSQDSISAIIETTKNIEIAIEFQLTGGTIDTIFSDYSYLQIEEITQPVVTEYNNNIYSEISNPLTNDEVTKESPIGSIINYIGKGNPEHYLKCNGSIYNIVDYPYLSQHLLDTYGYYNIFGGDGITTFAVPNLINIDTDNITPLMTSNTTPQPYKVSSSSIYDSRYEPWKALNGIVDQAEDCWATLLNQQSGWFKIDLGVQTPIIAFSLYTRNLASYANTMPKNFTIEGSNNDIDFTILMTISNQIDWKVKEIREYELDKVANYRYYKINITENCGGNHTSFAEIKFKSISNKVEYIKCEPTHYAVNQYGGFESKVLFEGNANAVGDYILTDNVSNYDFVLVIGNVSSINDTYYETTNYLEGGKSIISGSSVSKYALHFPMNVTTHTSTVADARIGFNFIHNNKLNIGFYSLGGTSYTTVNIIKIIGIKGQLPTLLQGGTF